MLFIDDDSRHDFHKASTLLQVICQMLESEVARYHLQLEVVQVDEDDEGTSAMLVVANESFEDSKVQQDAFADACAVVSKRFLRKDDENTVTIEAGNFGLVTVWVTESSDFAALM